MIIARIAYDAPGKDEQRYRWYDADRKDEFARVPHGKAGNR